MTRRPPQELLEDIARSAGFGPQAYAMAERALIATLAELCCELPDADLHAIEEALPPTYGPLRAKPSSDRGGGDLCARVAARTHSSVGAAREQVASVLRVVSELVPEDARTRLGKHLEPELGALLQPRVEGVRVDAPRRAVVERAQPPSTLATGRAGSRHPVSEARPDTAHRHSVARSTDPHADTKLSSAHGTTQERMHETLADAAPPRPVRTLAGR